MDGETFLLDVHNNNLENVKVYISKLAPIKYEMNIGSLGKVIVFIKSREIIEEESAPDTITSA